jgi:hypothetical protein
MSNGPPTDENYPPPGNNGPSNNNNNTSNTNNNTTGTNSSNIIQTIGTTTNLMQANIRSRMTDFLPTNNADDDVSSISSEDIIRVNDPLPVVEQPIKYPITVINLT